MKYCVRNGVLDGMYHVARIEGETAKTIMLSNWNEWRQSEWGRPSRTSELHSVLCRFETFEAAMEAAARADVAFKAATSEVEAAKAVLSAAIEARKAAVLSALSA